MSKRTIPIDKIAAKSARLSEADWKRAEGAQQRYKDLLETKPRAKARYDSVMAEINARQTTLRRLREARALTQSTVAELLEMDQSEVSRLERRSDMLLSTLKRFVEASGGELHLIVQFPESGPVELLVGED
ncbi:MAG TPA: helix-turn-helix domain-containing protein [Acidimicrobiales bacterium]|nr:helix-turn-helix domain-containing protein [Acidimicrobiales bacterium]